MMVIDDENSVIHEVFQHLDFLRNSCGYRLGLRENRVNAMNEKKYYSIRRVLFSFTYIVGTKIILLKHAILNMLNTRIYLLLYM